MYYNNTKRFINVLDKIIYNYNTTIHSRTKYKPIEVNKDNEDIVYNNLFKIRQPIKRQTFFEGDKVRIQRLKPIFEKGYKPNWTHEIFTVTKVLNTSPEKTYIISDQNGETLVGSFYPQELLKVLNG